VARFTGAAACLVLGLALTASMGCAGNIALVGRPTLQLDQEEIFAEVIRVDTVSREIYLQPEGGGNRVVSYNAGARVLYLGREYPMTRLESGDTVSMQLKLDSRGRSYTDLVRVHETKRDRDRGAVSDDNPESKTPRVDGRVVQLDSRYLHNGSILDSVSGRLSVLSEDS